VDLHELSGRNEAPLLPPVSRRLIPTAERGRVLRRTSATTSRAASADTARDGQAGAPVRSLAGDRLSGPKAPTFEFHTARLFGHRSDAFPTQPASASAR
jgi:hypothetical protein